LIILFCKLPKTRKKYLRRYILNPLVKSGKLSLTVPDKTPAAKIKNILQIKAAAKIKRRENDIDRRCSK